jgi:membrane-bound metal-dependent hydrolase YbcI (DUF457 family)
MALARSTLRTNPPSVAWIALWSLILTNLPDVDYLFGFLIGRPNAFHRDWTHSLLFALGGAAVFLGIRSLMSGKVEIRSSLLVFGLISSHLIVDLFTLDKSDPVGIPLFWPFSSEHVIAPVILFRDVHKGVTNGTFFRVLFSSHNLATMGSELLIFGPFVAVSYWILNRKTQRADEDKK